MAVAKYRTFFRCKEVYVYAMGYEDDWVINADLIREAIMSQMSKYCKAFSVERFKEFAGWPEAIVTSSTPEVNSEKAGSDRACSYFFVHDDYRVTKGIYLDEDIVLKNATTEWIAFCKDKLQFEVPSF